MSTRLEDILRLSVAERIQLAGDIWDSIAPAPAALPLSDGQREELGRRPESYAQNPDAGLPWEELKWKVRRSHGV
jgi:putative addiction module component (TIGR02574 family)